MATHLDLEEQEQLDQLKHFWKQYGNRVTWLLIAVLAGFAAWNGWNWWQRDQAVKAGAMFDELDRAALAGDADKTGRVFADLKERYPRTAFAQQGGLLAAKLQFEKGKPDADRPHSPGWQRTASKPNTKAWRGCASRVPCSTRRSSTKR